MTQLKDSMSDIEKIRQEVERRKGYISVTHFAEELLSFIDSLPEEKPSEDLEEAADKYSEKHGFRVPYDGSNNFYDEVDVKASKEGFIAGAKWKANQMPMPEDTVIFQKGVAEGRRLEKDDLALTWEDVYQIIMINSQMEVSGDFDISQWEDYAEEHCKEVLKRFKNLKSK